MAASKMRAYWLVGVPLLGVVAGMFVRVDKHQSTLYNVTVYDHCKVDSTQNEVQVRVGDRVAWPSATALPYSANFSSDHTPFHTLDYSGTPIPAVGPAPIKVTGDANCHAPKSTLDKNCYFEYQIFEDGLTACNDPGVRVVPPQLMPVWQWLWFQLESLSKSFRGSHT
jgi:hypothetical protein